MSEFEPFDEQLAGALQRRAGTGATSVEAAHDAVLGRASHIRRRRAGAIGGVAMIALLIGGVALLPRGSGTSLAPSDTGDVLPSVDVDSTIDDANEADVEADEAGPNSTIDEALEAELDDDPTSSPIDDSSDNTIHSGAPVTTGRSVTGTTVAGGRESTVPGTTPSSGSTAASVTATSPSTPDDDESSTTVDDESSTTSDVAPPPIAPFTKTYQSIGGSITVSWNGSAFSLLVIAPAPGGFVSEIEYQEPLRIRVRLRSDTADSRIEIRVVDGNLVETIS